MTAKGVAKDFGRYLQSRRRARGLSLGVVSHQTKITLENLRHIENEQLDLLPSPVFVKGFIKSFAQAVDADPREAALRFENHLAVSDQTPAVNIQKPAASYTRYHLVLAVVLFAALIGATLFIAAQMHQSLPASSEAVEANHGTPEALNPLEEKSSELDKPQPTAVAKAPLPVINTLEMEKSVPADHTPPEEKVRMEPVNMPTQVTPSVNTLELRISAVAATWLKVVSDDKLPQEFLLKTDQHITLNAERQFKLTIGNAGGIRLMLNDQPVQVVGTSGQVVNLRLP